MKKVLIVGGTGAIGSVLTEKLISLNYNVISTGSLILDVTDLRSINNFHLKIKYEMFGGLIYCVGHCPPFGFKEEVKHSLLELRPEKLVNDFDLHVVGLLRIVQMMKDNLSRGAKILVISSGITQVTDETCPPTLFSGNYATVKSAQDELVNWWRRDPFLKKKKISIESIKLRAVDTLFHRGSPKELKPLFLLSLDQATSLIIDEFEKK